MSGQREHEGHEEIDGHGAHEELSVRNGRAGTAMGYRMRTQSALSPAEDQAMTDAIGCAIAVHSELGPGFLESIYRKAMCIEFDKRGTSYQSERPIVVNYRGVALHGQRIDLIVRGLVIVELKCVDRFHEVHERQVVSYLRSARLRGGLLINFNASLIKHGIKRIVL